ncbi:unnamed protein product [Kuraishia capsulata CBS 1993]|uniref:Prephenate dehydrogenase [NADP(+)] n=1 Tax=Kuraishia capsulata CBS 1993 TaxID=1382522 RepID=W6MF13_9ASCO|nr:uncharacterized protein KUCA_T00000049001 [Kuraishia capsulata CBS 1993]CDK24089.1 unnamed protein product [Kuraishia capsulata CBS 1993]
MMTVDPAELSRLQASKTIGIIGLGDMGMLYARRFTQAGWRVVGCDKEEHFERFKSEISDFEVVLNGHYVSRKSDYTIYSVEAENMDKIVSMYCSSTKVGGIVGGQTSCKNVEIAAFEKYLPKDVEIVSVHSLHGPKVNTTGQPLVLIKHRASDDSFRFVEILMSCLKSKIVYLSAEEHDKITADTQAVTHAAFLSMGVAWHNTNQYPWETPKWVGGLENAKINISLRIFSNKWHVYAGLAITNPSAHKQILQYATSVTELFTLMMKGRKQELKERMYRAKEKVFGHLGKEHEMLLNDDILQQFSLSKSPPEGKQLNSHLSILAIADSWSVLGIVPYDHNICSTPLFRIFLGITEYLFCTPGLLEECLEVGISQTEFREDDLEFTLAARSWHSIISFGSFDLYRQQFERTQKFFSPMLPEANKLGNEMIKTILERIHEKET